MILVFTLALKTNQFNKHVNDDVDKFDFFIESYCLLQILTNAPQVRITANWLLLFVTILKVHLTADANKVTNITLSQIDAKVF